MKKIEINTACIAIVSYLSLAIAVDYAVKDYSMTSDQALLLFFYVVMSFFMMRLMMAIDSRRVRDSEIRFKTHGAFDQLGCEVARFTYAYMSDAKSNYAFLKKMDHEIEMKFSGAGLQPIEFIDEASCAIQKTKIYESAYIYKTQGDTDIKVIFDSKETDFIKLIEWRIFAGLTTNENKAFMLTAMAPVLLPMVFFPFLVGKYRPFLSCQAVYSSFFNNLEIREQVQIFQVLAFDTLVKTLDSLGIDTSDLKMQRASVMNINVSGGNASFGNVVQGNQNKAVAGR